jgi:hypothetical protein
VGRQQQAALASAELKRGLNGVLCLHNLSGRRMAQVQVNHRNEVGMSQKFLDYLNHEHARLEQEIEMLTKQQRLPDQIGIARLKKLKLAVKDQIAQLHSGDYPALVA